MEVSISRAELLRGLNAVRGVVHDKSDTPILTNVLFRSDAGELTILGTDMEIAASAVVEAELIRSGAYTVKGETLYKIVRELPATASVHMSHSPTAGERVHLKCGRYKTDLPSLPTTEYPEMTTGEFQTSFEVAADALRMLIDQTSFAASTDTTRYYLAGVYLHSVQKGDELKLRAVATDGSRLSLAEIPLPPAAVGMPSVIIPSKTVKKIRDAIDDVSALVMVRISNSRIQVRTAGTTITSKIVDGTYPNYQPVIPSADSKIVLRVAAKPLAESVGRVAVVGDGKTSPVKINAKPGSLVITAQSQGKGSASEELDPEFFSFGGDEIEIGFQAKFVLDVLENIEGYAVWYMADPSRPVLITDFSNDETLYVLMPMRV